MATTATTTQSTAAKKAAATRRRNAAKRSAAAKKAAATRAAASRTPVEQVQETAERVVLIPVGAYLTARDVVVETVGSLVDTYSDQDSATKQLKKFERRGRTARNKLERDLKRTRTRVERELRQRRTRAQRLVKRNRTKIEREAKGLRKDVLNGRTKELTTQLDLVSTQVATAAQTAVSTGEKLVAEAQKRVANVA